MTSFNYLHGLHQVHRKKEGFGRVVARPKPVVLQYRVAKKGEHE
jgi:hypothetical protein